MQQEFLNNGIVVVGAIFVDIKGFPYEHYIQTGRNAGYIEYVHGGVCRNIAEDIVNSGYLSTLISLVDESALGEEVVKHLKEQGVNTKYIKAVNDGMGTWLAVFDENGDLAGSISKRPNLIAIVDILEKYGDEIFGNCEAIALEADLEKEILDLVLGYARKYNKLVYAGISNMSIARKRIDYFKDFACLVCNDIEAGQLFDIDMCDINYDILRNKMKESQIAAMVVTLGENGSIYVSDTIEGYMPAYKVDVVDTTGAGDAFFSGVVVGMTYHASIKEGVRIGTSNAANVIKSSSNVCSYREGDNNG